MTKIQIEPVVRVPAFDLDPACAGSWAGSSVSSHLLNALSGFLPSGEAFFVRTVNEAAAKHLIDAELHHAVQQFAKQETVHGRQHQLYNETVSRSYPCMARFLNYMERSWDLKSAISTHKSRLAITAAVEHLTTIAARTVLRSSAYFRDSDPEYWAIWRWHALEELEHKSVALDLFRAISDTERRLPWIMRLVTVIFALEYILILCALLKSDRALWKSATWRELVRIWKSSAAIAARRDYAGFFRRGFDPRDIDDSDIVLAVRDDPAFKSHVRRELN